MSFVHKIWLNEGNKTACKLQIMIDEVGNWNKKFTLYSEEVTCINCLKEIELKTNKLIHEKNSRLQPRTRNTKG